MIQRNESFLLDLIRLRIGVPSKEVELDELVFHFVDVWGCGLCILLKGIFIDEISALRIYGFLDLSHGSLKPKFDRTRKSPFWVLHSQRDDQGS